MNGIAMSMLEQIKQRLQDAFLPHHLEVLNESHKHNVAAGSESHFKVVLVSEEFEGVRKIKRHQQVYGVLSDEMTRIHALALHTYTAGEWSERGEAPNTPNCKGGE